MSDPSGAVTTDALSAAPDLGPAEAPATTPTPTEPQTTTDTATTTATPDAPDWDSLKEHPEISTRIKEEVAKEADRLTQQRMARDKSRSVVQKARDGLANEDYEALADVAREVPGLLADPEDGTSIPSDAKESDLRRDGFLDSPEYEALYYSRDRAALDKAFNELPPSKFREWVSERTAASKTADDKRIAAVAAALVEQEVNKRLGSTPTPIGGASGGATDDAQFTVDYMEGKSNDHARWQRIQSQLR
jgi:hypothetical protein